MISRNTFPEPQPDSASYVTKLLKTTQDYPVACTCPEYSVVYRGRQGCKQETIYRQYCSHSHKTFYTAQVNLYISILESRDETLNHKILYLCLIAKIFQIQETQFFFFFF